MKVKQLKMLIREVVREEIRLGLKEVIGDFGQPTKSNSKENKVFEKKSYTNNSVLNDAAASDEWKTMGGGTFDSSKMNDVMSGQYGDIMNSNPNTPVSVDGQTPDFLKKDYKALMKAVDKKRG